jgi:hypothetical protein
MEAKNAKFTVHQISIDRSVYDHVNELGHDQAAAQYPQYRAYLDTTCYGSKRYIAEYAQFYKRVCIIDAKDLDDVFKIGNIGPEQSITRLAPMHSVSVGDIIEDQSGTRYMVDSFGFNEIV